jgi:hypothetical protein
VIIRNVSNLLAVVIRGASYHFSWPKSCQKQSSLMTSIACRLTYGKDVFGAVRLQEGRKHQEEARHLLIQASSWDDPDQRRQLKARAKVEKHHSKLKKLRWTLLSNGAKLPDAKAERPKRILSDCLDLRSVMP